MRLPEVYGRAPSIIGLALGQSVSGVSGLRRPGDTNKERAEGKDQGEPLRRREWTLKTCFPENAIISKTVLEVYAVGFEPGTPGYETCI